MPLLVSLLNLFSILFVVLAWLLILVNYPILPEKNPSHYNYQGEVDGYGNKQGIFFIPITSTVLFLILSAAGKYSNVFINFREASLSNLDEKKATTKITFVILKSVIAAIFLIIAFNITYTDTYVMKYLFLPLVILAMISCYFWYRKH